MLAAHPLKEGSKTGTSPLSISARLWQQHFASSSSGLRRTHEQRNGVLQAARIEGRPAKPQALSPEPLNRMPAPMRWLCWPTGHLFGASRRTTIHVPSSAHLPPKPFQLTYRARFLERLPAPAVGSRRLNRNHLLDADAETGDTSERADKREPYPRGNSCSGVAPQSVRSDKNQQRRLQPERNLPPPQRRSSSRSGDI